MSDVKCLLVFGDQSHQHNLKQGCGYDDVIVTLQRLFCNRQITVLQQWDNEWKCWSNAEKSFVIQNPTKMRGIAPKSFGNLDPSTSVVFCCDMQERFKPAIKYFDEISQVGDRLTKASKLLNIPLIVTEQVSEYYQTISTFIVQYPKGLGKTVAEIDISHASLVAEKTRFSMETPEVESYLENNPHIKSVVLFGVEAHVCVQQTAHDLMLSGFDVHIVADATSSRSLSDRHLAFQSLRHLGGFVTSCETVLLQWVADKNHPQFKEIQKLIRESPPETGLLLKSNI